MSQVKCIRCDRSFDTVWGLPGHHYFPGCNAQYEKIRKRLEEKGDVNEGFLYSYLRPHLSEHPSELINEEKLIADFETLQKKIQQIEEERKSESREN